jgi:hypothetical protein
VNVIRARWFFLIPHDPSFFGNAAAQVLFLSLQTNRNSDVASRHSGVPPMCDEPTLWLVPQDVETQEAGLWTGHSTVSLHHLSRPLF